VRFISWATKHKERQIEIINLYQGIRGQLLKFFELNANVVAAAVVGGLAVAAVAFPGWRV
jgi:hypothetical protein